MIDPQDVTYVAENMRESDAREVWTTSRATPWTALHTSIALSAEAHVFRADGVPAMIYGLGVTPERIGVPWLLGTNVLDKHRKSFMQVCKSAVRRWRNEHVLLQNRVLADNAESIRFLAALGFSFDEPQVNENGALVRRFWAEGGLYV